MKRLLMTSALLGVALVPSHAWPAAAQDSSTQSQKESVDKSHAPEGGQSLRKTREKFQFDSEHRLAAIDRKMKDLKEDASERMQEDMKRLRDKKASLIRKMQRLESATDRSWHRLKNEIGGLLDDIEGFFHKKDKDSGSKEK